MTEYMLYTLRRAESPCYFRAERVCFTVAILQIGEGRAYHGSFLSKIFSVCDTIISIISGTHRRSTVCTLCSVLVFSNALIFCVMPCGKGLYSLNEYLS